MDFIGFEEDVRDHSKKRKSGSRPAINKKTKINLVFDPEARRRFLTGFRKRKQERKNKYQEKLEKELIEEKARMREEAKKSINKKQSSSHSILPEVQHLLESEEDEDTSDEEVSESYDFGSTTVHISSLEDSLCSAPLKIKHESESDQDEEEENIDEGKGFLKYKPPQKAPIVNMDHKSTKESNALKLKKLKEALKRPLEVAAAAKTETLVRKEAHRLLQHSDVYKKALKYKQQHSRKFKLNRYQIGTRGGGGVEGQATAAPSKSNSKSKSKATSGSGSGAGGNKGGGGKTKNKKGGGGGSVKSKNKSKSKGNK